MNLPAILHPFRQASKIIAVALAIAACVLITSSSKAVGLTQTVSASASGDTQIRSANPNTNYGGATTITVDGDEPAGTGRDTVALIRFSLPTLPAGAAITDTKLRLGLTNSSANTYDVYVMKKAWVEGQATWNEYKTSNVWELAGGLGATDRESPAIASITPNTTGVRDYDLGAAFDQQVGDWMRGVEANNGIQLINANAPDGFDFFTREVATASQRPQLIITYDDGILADTTPPETTITSGPAEGGTLTTDSATFGFSSSEANSKFACSLDGAAYSACSSPKSYSSLADGPHTFSARATDAAGNTDATPASRTWTINTAATPASDTVTLSAVADTQIVENTPTTNYGAATEFEADGDDPGGSGTDIYTLLRFDLSSLPAGASITSANVALNVTNSSAQQYQSYEVKRSWAEGEATWNLASTGTPWGTAGAKAVSDRGQTPAANVLLQALGDHAFSLPVSLVQDWRDNPATNYGILISNVTNTDGWRAASKETTTPPRLVVNYSTSGGADTTPPETTFDSGPSGTVNSSSASFAFSSDEAGSTFECKLDADTFASCTSPKAYGGLSNGSHTFEVRATDAAGNTDATPASRTWTVLLPALPPPPSGTLEKFEPGDGQIYDGVDANQQAGDTVAISTQKWADYSANVLGGEKPLISHTFTGYDTNMTFDMEIAKARGAVPLVTWQTGSGTSPKTIANAGQASSGNRSDYVILKVAHALRTYDQPVFLRIDQEMNAYWFAWCAYNSDGTPRAHTTEDFKDMWRRMHIIFEGGTVSSMNQKLVAEGMPPLDPAVGTSAASKGLSSTTDPNATLAPTNNVAFVFNPVDAPGIPNKVGNLWVDYYPGDKYVDWVGQTSYDTTWNATLDVRFGWLGQFYQDFAVGHDKPYMMGEWGLEQYMGDDPAYIQRMLDWQKVHPKVKALVYFNVQTSKLEHRLEVYPNSAALMRADAPRYLDEVSVR